MQRATYGRTPPLHHPVPQHVSTVPQLRSPPPPTSQPHGGYDGSPYPQQPPVGAQSGVHNMFGPYGNFINDPAAQLATQFGQTAFRQGQEYIEQNVSCLAGRPLATRIPSMLTCFSCFRSIAS